MRGHIPQLPPPASKFPKLRKLIFEPSTAEALQWLSDCTHVVDVTLYHFPKRNIDDISRLASLRRVCFVHGKLTTLDGVENLRRLEILHVVACNQLTDVGAMLRSRSIKHVMFEKFKKIKNWDFLAQKESFETIWLEVAQSIAFIKDMPSLSYFFCRTVLNRDRSPLNDNRFRGNSPTAHVIYAAVH